MEGPEHIHFTWLLKLRWGATLGQLLLLGLCVAMLGLDIQWPQVGLVLGLGLLSNAWGEALRRRGLVRPWVLRVALTLDVALFSALLYFTGGPTNPFSFLYLVYIALGAVVLEAAWSWALAVLAATLLGLLYVVSPVPAAEHQQMMGLHLKGMWVAFTVAAGFIVYFTGRVSHALTQRERQLARTRRLASLATLATGAAHELSTPLSTIAVVARELERQASDATSRKDAALVRSEVDRCRAILAQLASDSGLAPGEALEPLSVRDWAAQVAAELGATETVQLDTPPGLALVGPRRALVQALKSVVDNGLKAAPGRPVRVRAQERSGSIELTVHDDGPGIREDLLAHIGEPFFTTREPGAGMGLGVFLARSVVEQAGGTLRIDSRPARGTRVTLTVPATNRRTRLEASGA
ncbi:MAG: HAMP domain-containing histidine kinase [Archangiaceae bacterium]|nr:HAMP domain-containing histidine kinase [Archangiaceae bacterium]